MRTYDTDVIVVGAGPAGMSAAVELVSAGCHVIVLDMQPAPGGQIFRGLEANLEARPASGDLLKALGPAYLDGQKLIKAFRSASSIDYRPGTTVWDLRSDGTVGWLRGKRAGYLRARYVVLANGAMERPVSFPGCTLPGVMTAGAVQTLIKAGRLKPEGRVALVGTGPLLILLANQLRTLGVKPVLIGRTDLLRDKIAALPSLRPSAIPMLLKGLRWAAALRLAGISILSGVSDLKATGHKRLERVSFVVSGKIKEIACDLLLVHDGIVPAIDLAHCAGLAVEWTEMDASWRPTALANGIAKPVRGPSLTESSDRIFIAGDALRIGGGESAKIHGQHVAHLVLTKLGKGPSEHIASQTAVKAERSLVTRAFLEKAFPIGLASKLPDDDAIVCRCEDITAGTIRAVWHGPMPRPHMRRDGRSLYFRGGAHTTHSTKTLSSAPASTTFTAWHTCQPGKC
jgi:NADPH-dependent 2,4-dienoyl-CoA reductase/sulfur reductase-like enzyme